MEMSRFSAVSLDLSTVDRTALWAERSFAALLDARMTDLKARFDQAGIPYDVQALETDPAKYQAESAAYRELLLRYAIDDGQADVLLAFSHGQFLDRLGDRLGVVRLAGESDDRLRARIQLAPEALASGTLGGYLYQAVTADLRVRDVGIAVVNKGTRDVGVELTILSTEGTGEPTDALMRIVRTRLYADNIRLTTDNLMVRACKVLPYNVAATLRMRRGPDPVLVKANATAALAAAADRMKRVGGDVPASALSAALYTAGVDRVTMAAPLADLAPLRFQAAHMAAQALTVEVTDQ